MTIGVAIALVAATLGVLLGTPARDAVFKLLDGSSFVSDTKNGALVHASGSTGAADVKVKIDADAKKMDIIQRDGYAYTEVTRKDGTKVLYRVGNISNGKVKNRSRELTGDQRLVRGGPKAYLVDENAGTVMPVEPDTLHGLIRKPLHFKRHIATTAGRDGSLLVAERASGKMYVVDGASRDSGTDVGGRGDDLALALVAGNPVLVNGTAGRAFVIERGEVSVKIDLPPGGRIQVPESTDRNELVVLQRAKSRLVVVDLDARKARQIPLQADDLSTSEPLATKWALFLADPNAGTVGRIDETTGKLTPVDGTPLGRLDNFQVFVKDDYLWINTPGEADATVIGPDGRSHTINKFKDSIPVVDATSPEPVDDPGPPVDPNADQPPVATPPVATNPVGPAPPPAPVAGAPSAPIGFTGQAGNAQITLSWQPPPDNGSPITSYRITCTPDCGPTGTTIDLPPTDATHTVTNLKNGKKHPYDFTIVAINAVGPSPQATAGPYTPSPDVPGQPTNVTATPNPNGTVTITWQRPDDSTIDPTSYTITATSNSTDPTWTGLKTLTKRVTDPTIIDTDTPSYTTDPDVLGYDDDDTPDFTFTVSAGGTNNTIGPDSDPSPPIDPYNAPAAPAPALRSSGDGTAEISWPVPRTGGRPITKYEATVDDADQTTTDPSLALRGLANGQPHVVLVRTVAGTDTPSAWSKPLSITTHAAAPALAPTARRSDIDTSSVDPGVRWAGRTGTIWVDGSKVGGTTDVNRSTGSSGAIDVRACVDESDAQSCTSARVGFDHQVPELISSGVQQTTCNDGGNPSRAGWTWSANWRIDPHGLPTGQLGNGTNVTVYSTARKDTFSKTWDAGSLSGDDGGWGDRVNVTLTVKFTVNGYGEVAREWTLGPNC
ncbi:MAG: fibronectin type III domain-containing protein [Acidimicrobiales bacterium]